MAAEECPKCGDVAGGADRCPNCGVVVPLYRAHLDKLRQGPLPATAGSAAVVAPLRTTAPPAAAAPVTDEAPAGPPPPPAAAPPAARRPAPAGVHRLVFHGTGGSLFGIHVVNVLLTLVTVGVYYFWARVRVRRYLLSQTAFADDRFAYHGTGRELLVGTLRAVGIFGVPYLGLLLLPTLWGAPAEVAAAAEMLAYILVTVFVPFAIVAARRYRFSRTSWRGVRFSYRGAPRAFISLWIGGYLLNGLTLGLYYPFLATRLQDFLVSHTWFGSERFRFGGQGRDLFTPYLAAYLLFLPTFGLYWFWFKARMQRYFWSRTTFGGLRFRSTMTGGNLLSLSLGNLLLLVFTLGVAWPWVAVRNARYVCTHLVPEGALDLAAVQQQAQAVTATGEGLAGLLDADLGLG